jgi:hypothetical protein
MAALFRIVSEPPLYELPADVDPHLITVLALMFARVPEKRPSAHQLLEHAAFQ